MLQSLLRKKIVKIEAQKDMKSDAALICEESVSCKNTMIIIFKCTILWFNFSNIILNYLHVSYNGETSKHNKYISLPLVLSYKAFHIKCAYVNYM